MGRNSRGGRFGNNPKFRNSHEYWRENMEHPHWNERDHSNSHVRPNVPHEIPFTDHALEFGLVATPNSENLEPTRDTRQTRAITKSTQEVLVFAESRNEAIIRPRGLTPSDVLEVSLVPVLCSDVRAGSDIGIWTFQHQFAWGSGFFSAKSGVLSEDAEPLLVSASSHGVKQRMFIGVFDGMGGAGASLVDTGADNGKKLTEAYRASRIARIECLNFTIPKVVNGILGVGRDEISGRDLTAHLQNKMKEYAQKLGIGPGTSRIRGTLTKTLPTTLACADVSIERVYSGELRTQVRALWAGDSRIWVLTPSLGLQQLTRDDVDIEDPLEQLRQDPPMTNVVSASIDFVLKDSMWTFSGPCVLIAATDGVSGYVRSPDEVEHHILQSFYLSETSGAPVARILNDTFSKIAHDDVSCVVTVVGFSGVTELNQVFSQRRREAEERYISLNVDVSPEEFSQLVDNVWAGQRQRYCEKLQGSRQ